MHAKRAFEGVPAILEPGETREQWESRRQELLDAFERLEYGKRPPMEYQVRGTVKTEDEVFDGAATRRVVEIEIATSLGSHAFPLYLFVPKANQPVPATLLICSQSRHPAAMKMPDGVDLDAMQELVKSLGVIMDGPMPEVGAPRPLDMATDMDNGHWPVPSIVARGHAAAGFYAADVEADDAASYPSGLAKIFGTQTDRSDDCWGVLAVWAFAARCALDYLITVPELDSERIGVIGHSRCGKAALWAGAQDERFRWVVPNNSGCCGSALLRGKHGENLASITRFFPHWFAPGFARFAGREERLPIDQHMLLALVAPRMLYVTSASEDAWSDPESEYHSTFLANEVFRLYGSPAMPEEMPQPQTQVEAGAEGYHLRQGKHLLTEYDWMRMLDHVERNLG